MHDMRSVLALLAALMLLPASAHAAPGLRIDVLSNRADLISAGDALVAIDLPARVDTSKVKVTDDGRDVTSQFAQRPNGKFEGLLTGLDLGPNVIRATAPDVRAATLTITNHPNGGPVFSGPQVQPWVCQDTARDAQCNE